MISRHAVVPATAHIHIYGEAHNAVWERLNINIANVKLMAGQSWSRRIQITVARSLDIEKTEAESTVELSDTMVPKNVREVWSRGA